MSENRSEKILLKALRGRKAERVPFWFMRQAGRYLPEYRALRIAKGSFLNLALNPSSAAEATLQPIRRFGMDGAIIFSDILMLPYGLGQELDFREGEGPVLGDLAVSALSFDDFEKRLEPVFEALSKVREQLKKENFNDTALIGFAGGPWTVACYMIEGKGGTGFPRAVAQAQQGDENFRALIDLLTEATTRYLLAQVEAGAEALQIFESWAGLLQGKNFEDFIITPTRKIITAVKRKYPDIPVIGFPRGAGDLYLYYAERAGADVISFDQHVEISWIKACMPRKIPVQGNLDPALLKAGGESLENAAKTILAGFSGRSHIFNLGHGIDKNTPLENMELLCRVIRDFNP